MREGQEEGPLLTDNAPSSKLANSLHILPPFKAMLISSRVYSLRSLISTTDQLHSDV
ncbi:hypothetical protein ARMSODRAFT_956821 [Armillaria solidipes]|uniref:Uncharacterized protein n=1 Tax=Armillaria solidipes TaxID=1076256 RepID=A0A2H3C1W8_9AGAR|nr:hypothetical protein ARMSODRAFT_956821 [Armillaria solidipes]